MKNKTLRDCQKSDSARRPALNRQLLAPTCLSLLEDKSRMAPNDGLTNRGETERATAHLPTVFDNLYYNLEHLCDEKSAQLLQRRTVAISWEESDELVLKINVVRHS